MSRVIDDSFKWMMFFIIGGYSSIWIGNEVNIPNLVGLGWLLIGIGIIIFLVIIVAILLHSTRQKNDPFEN